MYNQGAKIGTIPEKTKFLAVFAAKKSDFPINYLSLLHDYGINMYFYQI